MGQSSACGNMRWCAIDNVVLVLYAAQGCKSHLWLGAWLDC